VTAYSEREREFTFAKNERYGSDTAISRQLTVVPRCQHWKASIKAVMPLLP